MEQMPWEFAIDVGGTFCDVVARDPHGRTLTHKLLSSGRTRGIAGAGGDTRSIVDDRRRVDPPGYWNGFHCDVFDAAGGTCHQSWVKSFDADDARLILETNAPAAIEPGSAYELFADDEAPVLAIRYLMKLRRVEPIPPCRVRLGTTLATNALLERRGGRVALVTTTGFADMLHIGDQTRPNLFTLNIQKPAPLVVAVLEVAERVDAEGRVLEPLDREDARRKLAELHGDGIDSAAVCLMNAYRNPIHEQAVAKLAQQAGLAHVSVSTSLSPTQRILPRAESCVVDAYLAPVLRNYLASIERCLPGSTIRMMTGSGGLVSLAKFSGPASVLSGPAGGLVGCAHVAERAGFERAIAFDMGGTSTDVSRCAGSFEYQYETRTAGVRIVAPVLAIETVAAGGGSICRFDGVRFLVGPRSAGTDPGPACYGRGGPLTLTDANLHLGKIRPDRFPFPLDGDVVARRLDELVDAVFDATKRRMSHDEIAGGFVDIANANMAAAVKRITIERGIDARDHVLVSFGGAGGQHACAIARSLGMTKILLAPMAGVLSAYGIALADVKRFAERPIHKIDAAELDETLEDLFVEMERSLAVELREENVPADRVRLSRFLDVLYTGEGTALTVEAKDWRDAFERLHRSRYGYVHADRAIEIAVARVEAVGSTDQPARSAAAPANRPLAPVETVSVVLGGKRWETAVFDGHALSPGDCLEGPAIIAQSTSTMVVDPGWRAEVTAEGNILLTDDAKRETALGESTEVDPVRLELFNNHFSAVAEQMGTMLRRTALSTNVKERLDFSCAVFDENGDLIANAPHIPVHLGSMGQCVKAVLADFPKIGAQDVVVTNDPLRGGTHLPDVTVVTPVCMAGERRFFVASRAHHAEIGGTCPGSMPPDSMSLADEGVLIRPFKVVDAGRERFDTLRSMLTAPPHPSRSPDENIADLIAQIAANKAGVDALTALVAQRSFSVVSAYTRHVRDAAERKMRAAIEKLPDGVFVWTDSLDDGSPICVRITIAGREAIVDFSGTAAVLAGNLNAGPAVVVSAVLYSFRCLMDEDIPLNAGVLAPIRLILPPSMLNPPSFDDPARCPAVVGGNVETSQRIVDCIFGALKIAAASQGTMNNVCFGDDRFAYYETVCGGAGAGPDFDGADAVHTHMTNTRLTDPEVLEARYPVRLRRFAIRRGSGGTGLRRGGDGCVREIEFLASLELSLITQRRTTQPYGLEGGGPGAAGRNVLLRHDSLEPEELSPIVRLSVGPGDRLIIETPGGGGYGVRRMSKDE